MAVTDDGGNPSAPLASPAAESPCLSGPGPVSAIDEDQIEFYVSTYDDLARRLARRYSRGAGVDEDLLQVARLGLVQAAQRFDPAHGVFASFAVPTIIGTLKKHLRSSGWALHVPRSVQENTIAIENRVDDLTQTLGRSPSIKELAQATGLTTEQVHLARRARDGRFFSPLPLTESSVAPAGEETIFLRHAVQTLTDQQKELLTLRYVEDLTQHQIAERIGVSQPQVHRMLTSIAGLLRDHLAES